MSEAEKLQTELLILKHLQEKETIEDSFNFAHEHSIYHPLVVGVIKSLLVDAFVVAEELSVSFWVPSEEAISYASNGTPECQVFKAVPEEGGISREEIESIVGKDILKIGQGACMKNKWLKIDKTDGKIYRQTSWIVDELADLINILKLGDGAQELISAEQAQILKKRKLISLQVRKSYKVTKGPNYSLERKRNPADLTKEMLDNGSWESATFKPYNFKTLGLGIGGGHLHPLMKVRTEFRRVLMDMGFEEMPTNRYVESSFWNFDALFQPQSHPARDAHDTFFLSVPKNCHTVPEDYYKKVENMHENGGYGSIGHGKGTFTREESTKNILRTHTTAISARMLYKLAQQSGGFQPKKYFSIDRVFRNETMDATHLAEFHQVEGVVADYDLSLGDLIGIIKNFFSKIGITDVRFKPAYNPYTEPSMEIFAFHPDLKKWTEVGNSGVFRPEMLRPMGLPENVRVIAWGLSLERPTMIKYNLSNIRDLFGHKIDLDLTRTSKLFRV